MELAHRVTDYILHRHPEIVAISVFGSTAKGEDREHSDVEMRAYTKGESNTRIYFLVHDDVVIQVEFESEEEALRNARNVHPWWPIAVDQWTSALPMHDPEGLLPKLAKAATRLDPHQLPLALSGALTMFYENLCKMRNFEASGEDSMVRFMAPYCVVPAANYLALLNGQHFNGFRNLLTKPRDFEILPPHFWEDYPALLAVEGLVDQLLQRAERLYRECRALWPHPGRAPWEAENLETALARGRIPRPE